MGVLNAWRCCGRQVLSIPSGNRGLLTPICLARLPREDAFQCWPSHIVVHQEYAPEKIRWLPFRRAVSQGVNVHRKPTCILRGDAHFVAIHDSTLDRTTTRPGRSTPRWHCSEIRKLGNAGSWFASEFIRRGACRRLVEVLEFAAQARRGCSIWN